MMDRIESQTSGDIQKLEEKRYIYIHQFPYPGDDMGHLPAVQLTATSNCAETGTVPLVRTPACCWTDPYHRKQRDIPISLYIYIHMWVSYCCCCHPVLAVFTYRSFNRVRATNASSSIWRIKLFFKSLGMWEKIGKN